MGTNRIRFTVTNQAMGLELPGLFAIAPSLAIDFDAVPLRDVAKVWNGHPKRVVLVP